MTRNEKKTAIENMAERFMNISDLEGKSMAIMVMGLNRMNRQSKRVLSLRSRVRGGMSEHAQSQRKEPLTSRKVSRHGMSCKSASRHTVVSASFAH